MKRRVAIIGGGLAGLTAAYELSRTAAARERWDVTVYEMNHLLGGRLASAHHDERFGRNEEHGLHVWFGFYDNAFRLAEAVWADAPRLPNCPWPDLWSALRPVHWCDLGIGPDDVRRLDFPRNLDRPGRTACHSPQAVSSALLDLPRAVVSTVRALLGLRAQDGPPRALRQLRPLERLIERLADAPSAAARVRIGAQAERLLRLAHRRLARLADRLAGRDPGRRELACWVDLGLAVIRGACSPAHGVLRDFDLDRICAFELRAWLEMHGASASTLEECRLLAAVYDIPFAFRDGRPEQPVMEASTALRYSLMILLGYKGAPAFLLRGGAGETLVAPLYQVLRERGVRFEFFHRLVDMDIDGRGRRVEGLEFVRMAETLEGYEPLVERGGLFGFRGEPNWEALRAGEAMRDRGVEFNSRFGDRGDDVRVELRRHADFDDVILALPLGCVAPDGDGHSPVRRWLDVHPPARASLEGLHLVPTVAAQVWLGDSVESLPLHERAVVAWTQPYSVCCDMTPVLDFESWPEPKPRALAYLCGAAPLDAHRAPSHSTARDRDFTYAREALDRQLRRHGRTLFGCDAAERARYVRANVEAWELADLPLPGADASRLEATDSGLHNLALAGTWVRNRVNTTSLEAAVCTGIAAARALGAQTQPILGESFLRRPPTRLTIERGDALIEPPVTRHVATAR